MKRPGKISRLWIGAEQRMLDGLDRLRTRSRRAKPIVPHLETGMRGERAAFFELRRRGVVMVARRWTSPKMRGDIDLVGWDGDRLCFIEVKTRTARDLRPAESAVDENKREMLRGLARIYLHTFPERERQTILVRFDVISVYAIGGVTEFQIFEGAFGFR